MATRKAAQPQSSMAPLLVAGGAIGAVAATVFQMPGAFVLWAFLIAAAWMEPPFIPESKGIADPVDQPKRDKYAFWTTLKTNLLPLSSDWLPGVKIADLRMSWFLALLVAAIAAFAPEHITFIDGIEDKTLRIVNAVCAFAVIVGVTGAKRRVTDNPGVTLGSFSKVNKIARIVAPLAGAAVIGGFGGAIWKGVVASPLAVQHHWTIPNMTAFYPVWVVFGAAIGLMIPWRSAAFAHWREVVAQRELWAPRWFQLKQDPAPRLYDTALVGPCRVDYFVTRSGASTFIDMSKKITPTIGAGMRVAYLTVPDENSQGPIPGSAHPNKFAIAQWPSDQFPDLFDPEIEDDVRLLASRSFWQPRWEQMKLLPAPEVLESKLVGPARIETFQASHLGVSEFLAMNQKIAGSGMSAVTAHEDSGPGSMSDTLFDIIHWKQAYDITAPDADPEIARLAIKTQFVKTCELYGGGTVLPVELERLSEDDAPAAWHVEIEMPNGAPGWENLREGGYAGHAASQLGAEALVDHRNGNMFMGDFDTTFVDTDDRGNSDIGKTLHELSEEDRWDGIWAQAMKVGLQPPTIQHATVETKKLADGTPITRYAFGVRGGLEPSDFFPLDDKLRTALVPAPFLTITGWTYNVGKGRSGERHPQAFTVYHAEKAIPASPDKLKPADAAEWALAGMVNKAFKDARLPQPEMVRARALTDKRSPSHIWEIQIRLYGGATLSDVRGARERLRGRFGVPWLRVAPAEDGCIIYCGAVPKSVKLASPSRDELLLAALDWDQAWIDSGVTGAAGMVPRLTNIDHMKKNEKVSILDFDLPPGVAIADIKKGIPKLKTGTSNEFIDVRATKNASKVQILCSEINPMPFPAPYDLDEVLGSKAIPFGVGVDGDPLIWDPKSSAHLLVLGVSGGGKSAAMQMLIEGIMLRGWELYIIDPSKGAADFQFAEPWCNYIAVELFESAALMRGLYEEVRRRVEVNSKYGVGSYRDLPEEIRPNHVVIVLDEFMSLIEPESVSRTPYDDFEAEKERQAVIAQNNARAKIGQLAGKITREARSAGISLMLASQELKADSLSKIPGGGSVKTNSARILLGNATIGQRASALKSPENAPELGTDIKPGRGVYEPTDGPSKLVQVWYDGTDQLAEWLDEHAPRVEKKFDVTPWLQLPSDEDDGPAIKAIDLNSIIEDVNAPVVTMDAFSLDELETDMDDDTSSSFDLSSLVVGGFGTEASQSDDDPFAAADDPFAEPENPFVDDADDPFNSGGEDSPEPEPVDEEVTVIEPEDDPWSQPAEEADTHETQPEPAIVEDEDDPFHPTFPVAKPEPAIIEDEDDPFHPTFSVVKPEPAIVEYEDAPFHPTFPVAKPEPAIVEDEDDWDWGEDEVVEAHAMSAADDAFGSVATSEDEIVVDEDDPFHPAFPVPKTEEPLADDWEWDEGADEAPQDDAEWNWGEEPAVSPAVAPVTPSESEDVFSFDDAPVESHRATEEASKDLFVDEPAAEGSDDLFPDVKKVDDSVPDMF